MATVSLTCQACHLLFSNSDEHRTHYRSDLHRLNAKRRAAALVPISQAEFNQRLQELSAAAPVEPAAAEFRCTTCDRVYSSAETLEQHLGTRKHKEAQLATGSAAPVTTTSINAPAADSAAPVTAEEEEEGLVQERLATARRIPPNECLFCLHTVQVPSGVAEAVTAHMASVHSFFIPDVEFLADLPGLLAYLAEKAAVGYACFYCPRSFWSLEAVRGHMRDLSHCKIKYDTDEEQDEFSEFFDFSVKSEVSEGGASAIASDAESEPVQRAHADERVQLSDNGFSMQLNGKSIGHRALRVYYRQAAPRQRPAPSEAARAITQVVGNYRLLGWRGSDAPKSERQARQEKRAQEKAASLALAVGVRQNRIQKNHPRDQTTIF